MLVLNWSNLYMQIFEEILGVAACLGEVLFYYRIARPSTNAMCQKKRKTCFVPCHVLKGIGTVKSVYEVEFEL